MNNSFLWSCLPLSSLRAGRRHSKEHFDLEDDKVSPDELKSILKEVRDVLKLLEE